MATAHPDLEPGRVYRTRDLTRRSANPTRLAKRVVRNGSLVPLSQGLFAHPKQGRFGAVPPSDPEVLRAFLNGAPSIVTGSDIRNALGLGTTAVMEVSLVYNTKRSGDFKFGSRTCRVRRVRFPVSPPSSGKWWTCLRTRIWLVRLRKS